MPGRFPHVACQLWAHSEHWITQSFPSSEPLQGHSLFFGFEALSFFCVVFLSEVEGLLIMLLSTFPPALSLSFFRPTGLDGFRLIGSLQAGEFPADLTPRWSILRVAAAGPLRPEPGLSGFFSIVTYVTGPKIVV